MRVRDEHHRPVAVNLARIKNDLRALRTEPATPICRRYIFIRDDVGGWCRTDIVIPIIHVIRRVYYIKRYGYYFYNVPNAHSVSLFETISF